MNRIETIRTIIAQHPEAAFIFCNGLTSREVAHVADRPGNFYQIHGMGETLAVGIGLKMARPDLEVIVVDGDGNAVMGLSALTLLPIEGLTYYVLVNNSYETTGSQAVPPLNFDHPAMIKIAINPGKLAAPNPPLPETIRDNFMNWLAKDNNV